MVSEGEPRMRLSEIGMLDRNQAIAAGARRCSLYRFNAALMLAGVRTGMPPWYSWLTRSATFASLTFAAGLISRVACQLVGKSQVRFGNGKIHRG
jgi:hypothetical protein